MSTKIEYENFSQNMRNVELYIENNHPVDRYGKTNYYIHIYDTVEWLKNCLRKKIARGIQPTIEHLANCSTMKAIIREGERVLKYLDEQTLTTEERKQLSYYFAEMIISEL